jgi:Berberine and berberine like
MRASWTSDRVTACPFGRGCGIRTPGDVATIALAHPWGSGGVYPNFPDPDLTDWERAYHGSNYARLARAEARYDPDGVFSHQSVRLWPEPVRAG